MKHIIFWILGSLLVLALAGYGWYYYNTSTYAPVSYVTETPAGPVVTNTETGATTTTVPAFTMTDIAAHKDATSCYSVISGSVYDLTAFVNMHPGGKGAILSICGIDGTEKFMNKHHGGTKFMNILARYKVGTLQ